MVHTLDAYGLDPDTPISRLNVSDLDDLDLEDDDESVLVVGQWSYAGRGHTPGQAIYAATIAEDLAESRRIWRQTRQEAS